MSRHAEATSPVKSSGPLSIWFSRHGNNAAQSLARLFGQPFSSLMIVLVIAITLALPAALSLVVRNAAAISGNWDNALDFSVFLQQSQSLQDAENLANLIRQRADVGEVTVISADEAMAEFRRESGFGDALEHLSNNPLPHTLVVRPSAVNTQQSIHLLREELNNLPETDLVQVDTDWVNRFHAILDIVRQAILIGSVLLALAIVVIIGNTIRLDIQNRREEIEVTKLIGASNAFVRRPFLWTGFWYGLLGGLLGVALVWYSVVLLRPPVARLANLYQSNVDVLALSLNEIGLVVAIGVSLGLLGSWVAAARHMRRIEPR